MKFEKVNLIKPLLRAVADEGYEEMTPIQEQIIPFLLAKKDVIGCAQTGTGKTAAFALPILQTLSKSKSNDIRALILTPTRELAIQIYNNFRSYGKHLKVRTGVIYGGVKQGEQVKMLEKGVDVLVATPGRLNDLLDQGVVSLDKIEIFVLDEADRMLDMGFVQDVKKILRVIPKQRQTLLFSATMPKEIERLASSMLKNPETVKVAPVTSTVDAIHQCVYFVDKPNKPALLAHILSNTDVKNALVFTRTKHGADRVAKKLLAEGIPAGAIHGDKRQSARQEVLNRFKKGKLKVLVATDIAARGIDISELSHVFNYDMPEVPETYIHRIGRTGRAGLEGTAINFCNYDELENLRNIEKHTGNILKEEISPWPMEIFASTTPERGPARSPRVSRPQHSRAPGRRRK